MIIENERYQRIASKIFSMLKLLSKPSQAIQTSNRKSIASKLLATFAQGLRPSLFLSVVNYYFLGTSRKWHVVGTTAWGDT